MRTSFKHAFYLFVAALTFSSVTIAPVSVSAADMDLATAKKVGLIGEKSDGLVAATLPNPSSEITSLVNRTNKGRLGFYKETANKQSIPLEEVQKIAAQKIFNLAASGEFLMINGQWSQKK
ncbi:MAG: YdbL family protein [Alphaproteobacteria bacterium]|nr:YdbL family protein [Alphaproteobacteria bacterium]MCB1551651.1 YdbL family protein [Alphaproteobacteria bacterium]MCB9984132.1 YdbL family protein [Micavibrio sp.]HPQ50598.1 YdbL family protein [Alphaproteobacteria bacterium]HRK96979.1 YdbL family protein [Alphaproteobacteria bacterium]